MIELTKQLEVSPGIFLNINNKLARTQHESLTTLLKAHQHDFSLDYHDMQGLNPILCMHIIYINKDCKPIWQPQRRVNPTVREIVKKKLQKMLDAGFIYPILDSQWVSPLVIVPNKGGK